jgi:adenosine deaminase
VTIHVGEEGGEYGIADIHEVVSTLRPDRIGHGILAARDKKLMTQICEAEIVLEICPTSNLLTKALESEAALRDTFRAFAGCHVQFTIATDDPEMVRTHLPDEFELLLAISALDESQVSEANRRGHEASFIPHKPLVQRA